MTRTRYTMPARSQGKLYAQRAMAGLVGEGVHRWVFVYGMDPGVEALVRKWLTTGLDSLYCDLQAVYLPHLTGPTLARTHIVLDCPPPPTARAERDEIVPVGLRGAQAREAVKAIVEAMGLNPHLSVCGWPFCLDDADDVDDMEGGCDVAWRS